MSNLQTDNSFLLAKIKLRMNHLPKKDSFSVIDAFTGEGLIWDYIKNESKRDIEILKIDKRNDIDSIYLKGDNLKFICCIPLENFDVIDLDAYGICFDLLHWIITYDRAKNLSHRIFVTFNQNYSRTGGGALPYSMLNAIGYSDTMIKKIPSLFSKKPLTKFMNYLSVMNVKKSYFKSNSRHNYIFFQT